MILSFSTERLHVRSLLESDAEFIRQLVNSPGWLEFIGDRNVHSKEDGIAYIQKIQSMPNVYYWVVCTLENEIPIGILTFLKRDYLDHFDIGFAFLPEYHGKGFAFESAAALFSRLTQLPEHKTILATTIPRNVHSIQLLTKLGMRFLHQIEIDNEILHVYHFSLIQKDFHS